MSKMSNTLERGYSLEYVIKTRTAETPTSASSVSSSDSSIQSTTSLPTSISSGNIVPTVMDEEDVLSFSCSRTSLVVRHKQAAKGRIGRTKYEGRNHSGSKSLNCIADEFEEIQERNQIKRLEHATTDFQTFSHILKGNIGTGLLALPYAVKNSGIIVGAVGLLIMGIIATHCMAILVKVANELCKRRGLSCLNYAEAARVAVSDYCGNKWLLKSVGVVVNSFLVITQFGLCCVYLIFTADNIQEVFCTAFDVHLDQRVWIAIILFPLIVLCWIKNLEELSTFSLIANVCILFSMVVILYAVVKSFLPDTDFNERAAVLNIHNLNLVGSVQSTALFFGGVVYAFEGIGMVLPLENKMKNPHHAKPVIYAAMIIVTLLYTVFGTVGYLVYGNSIESSITLNLVSQEVPVAIVYTITKFFYAYAIFATFLLQFYVPMDFIEPSLYSGIKLDLLPYWFPRHHKTVALLIRMLFRAVVVVLIAVIAVAVPDLGDLISLVGAFSSSALTFIFPALLDLLTYWPSRQEWVELFQCQLIVRLQQWKLIFQSALSVTWALKNFVIIALGVIGMILGTYASIAGIVANVSKHTAHDCTPLWLRH